jgi:hypothetical protein
MVNGERVRLIFGQDDSSLALGGTADIRTGARCSVSSSGTLQGGSSLASDVAKLRAETTISKAISIPLAQSAHRSKFFFRFSEKYAYLGASRFARGALRIVTSVESGMRWTRFGRKTSGFSADGQGVWS